LWTDHAARSQQLKVALQSAIQQRAERVVNLRRRLDQLRLDQTLQQETQRLNWLRQRLAQTVQYRLQTAQQQCQHLHQTLQTLNPESVLKRGYAVVRDDRDRILTSAENVNIDDTLRIQLTEGAIMARVMTVEE
ncbi:MAG: exodeoxyribonuclease VII large subunit, partial [Cyanobacteria bacterium J06636_16]